MLTMLAVVGWCAGERETKSGGEMWLKNFGLTGRRFLTVGGFQLHFQRVVQNCPRFLLHFSLSKHLDDVSIILSAATETCRTQLAASAAAFDFEHQHIESASVWS